MFCYGMASFDFIYNYSSTYATYLVSDKIISLFSNDDLRKTTFWDKNKKHTNSVARIPSPTGIPTACQKPT